MLPSVKRGAPSAAPAARRRGRFVGPLLAANLTEPTDTGTGDELRDFLRARRGRITPEQAGLATTPGVRRAPGLRRAEVAQLAGVSADFYGRLEGGRARAVPEPVLEALARALRLDEPDRDELFAAARPAVARRRPMRPQRVRPGLRRVLDALTDAPALVLGHRLDVLAANRLARAFYPALWVRPARPAPRRTPNAARYLFAAPAARELYRDWPAAARGTITALHRYAALHPHDPQLADLVGELSLADPDFRRWWGEDDRAPARADAVRYRHPLVGDITLVEEVLISSGDADQSLEMHTAEPGSASEAALRLLAVVASGVLTR
jgi:transcriptional regulator with XRE-family HTH domain